MNLLSKVKTFFKKDSRQRWEEEYLSQAKDVYDLEQRQKRLERGEIANQSLWYSNTHNTKGK